jgi:hypothetical protein
MIEKMTYFAIFKPWTMIQMGLVHEYIKLKLHTKFET